QDAPSGYWAARVVKEKLNPRSTGRNGGYAAEGMVGSAGIVGKQHAAICRGGGSERRQHRPPTIARRQHHLRWRRRRRSLHGHGPENVHLEPASQARNRREEPG